MRPYKLVYFLLFMTSLLLIFSACEKDEEINPDKIRATNSEPEISKFINDTIMNEIYLWFDQVPDIDINNYTNASEVFNALIYKEKDKWSFITSITQFENISSGKDQSYGIYFQRDTLGKIRVAYVYENGPMAQSGIKRSDILLSINSQDVDELLNNETFNEEISKESNTFVFTDDSSNTDTLSISQSTFQANAILYKDTITVNNTTTGYCVLNTFMNYSREEIDTAFSWFHNAGVDEMILDMRYNGGGVVSIAQDLASILAPAGTVDETFLHFAYNSRYDELLDTIYNFNNQENNLDIERLFVITTSRTASASEAIINGLKPYMDVIQIGNTTHGKPVGMNTFYKKDYAISPVTFALSNSEGEAKYDNGLQPDYRVFDDVCADFGDPHEDCLETALNLINNETAAAREKSMILPPSSEFQLKGIRHWMGCY